MKIDFEDGSFLTFVDSNKPDQVTLVMCGIKGPDGATVMSSAELTGQQVVDIVGFLEELMNK